MSQSVILCLYIAVPAEDGTASPSVSPESLNCKSVWLLSHAVHHMWSSSHFMQLMLMQMELHNVHSKLNIILCWVHIPLSGAPILFSLEKGAVLSVVDLSALPLPCYLVVDTCLVRYYNNSKVIPRGETQVIRCSCLPACIIIQRPPIKIVAREIDSTDARIKNRRTGKSGRAAITMHS